MLGDPRVSACIVLYHTSLSVKDTVHDLMHSTEPVELYVVDNSPKDLTARSILLEAPDAHVLPQKRNLGFGAANNQVLPLLHSHYHLICNPDVTFDETLLHRMVTYLDAHPDIAALTPRVFFPDGREQFLPRHRPTVRYLLGGFLEKLGRPFTTWRAEYTMQNVTLGGPMEVEFATGCFLLIRTNVFYKMQGFDPKYFLYQEDSDLSVKIQRYGKIVYHPDFQIRHNWNRADKRSWRLTWYHIRSTFRFFRKWGLRW